MAVQRSFITQQASAGDIVRRWRKARRLSQMDLAELATVSTRHLSFVETGRARPSDDLILRLAEALRLPLRHTNALLVAAGYAPRYSQWSLHDDDHTGVIRAALERIMQQHEPYPALVVDRTYEQVMVNQGLRRLVAWLLGENSALAGENNLMRLVFDPAGLRPYFANWEMVQSVLLKRMREESLTFQNEMLARLYQACAALADEPEISERQSFEQALPVLLFTFKKDGRKLSFFSTVSTFGTAIDVTVQELRIESLFPADDETRAFFE